MPAFICGPVWSGLPQTNAAGEYVAATSYFQLAQDEGQRISADHKPDLYFDYMGAVQAIHDPKP